MTESPKHLDFGLVQPQLTELLFATGNWIERSWPGKRRSHAKAHEGTRALLLNFARSTENSWRSAAYLCADIPKDPARRPEYVLSVSPLTRTILEALCTTIFVFGDLEARVAWFYKSGWREVREESLRVKERYGDDPEWEPYLSAVGALLDTTRVQWGVSDDEAANPSLIKRFPIPDRMISQKGLARDRREQIQYFLDWYYRKMSQDAHLSWPGLARRAGVFLPATELADRENIIARARADILGTLAAVCLAFVSEMEVECRFGMAAKATYAWTILSDFSPDTKELYERFYQTHLTA